MGFNQQWFRFKERLTASLTLYLHKLVMCLSLIFSGDRGVFRKTMDEASMRKSIMKPVLASTLSALLILELSGCGTIIYPERRGQVGGRIDPTVVIMDGIGLLFWVIPGVIAFAVDFATGAIYTSSGRYSVAPEALQGTMKENGEIDTVQLQEIIKQQTGKNIPLNHPNLQLQPSSPELLSQLNIVPNA